MRLSVQDSVLFTALFTLLLASLLGVLWTWFWALRRLWLGIPLLSDMVTVPPREIPWGTPTIIVTILLYLLVSLVVVKGYALATGRHLPRQEDVADRPAPAPPTPDRKSAPHETAPEKVAAKAGREALHPPATDPPLPKGPGDKTVQSQGELMLQSAIINSLLLVMVPPLVLRLSRARPEDLGWDTRNWPRQILQGVRAGMLITPVVFTVQSIAVKIWRSQKHPLEQMVMERFTPGAAALAVISAMFLAPLVEELLFRGLLQQWLEKMLTFGSAGIETLEESPSSSLDEFEPSWESAEPDESTDDIESVDSSKESRPKPDGSIASILLTSALFAGMHYLQWPAPIAIFLLAMWLGTIFIRSRSLITVIALHATFNGFSTVMLLLEALSRKIEAAVPPGVLWLMPESWF